MTGKIFIATKNVLNLGEHLYLVYDPDGDPETTAGQKILRAGPQYPGQLDDLGNIFIEVGESETDSEDALDTDDPLTDRHYTELNLNGGDADTIWGQMLTFAATLGTYDAIDQRVTMDVDYHILGPNSNSFINTVLSAFSIDLRDQAPHFYGDLNNPEVGLYNHPGHMGLLDGSGDDDFTAFSYWGVSDTYVFNDSAGNDTITVENGATITITNDGDTNDSNTLILKDFDAADIMLTQHGDALFVWDTSGVANEIVAILNDHFGTSGPGTVQLQIDDGGTITTKGLANLDSGDLGVSLLELPTWYENTVTWFGVTITGWWDPLVIDLDNDGIATDASSARRYFDLDNNGSAEATRWAGADDGVLARDLNDNGRIDNGSELFGNATTNGFAALAAFDANTDGVINSSDAVWADLVIWQDKNSDGQTQSDELLSLASLNITGINVSNVSSTPVNSAAGSISHTGTVTTTTGTLAAGNYNFSVDKVNTQYTADYDFDIRTAFLPNLRGYNEMPDLRIAMSLDNDTDDPDSLLSIVQDIASYTLTDIFENYYEIMSKVEAALYRWAGVDAVDPESRGDYIRDARQLAFMEEYFGQGFIDNNGLTGTNPGLVQAEGLHDLWDNTVFARLKSAILLQLGAEGLFEAGQTYNYGLDALEGSKELSQAAIDALEAAATGLANTAARQAFWMGVAAFLHDMEIANNGGGSGSSNDFDLTSAEITMINDAIENSDAALTWSSAGHDPGNGVTSIEYRYYNPVGETLTGTSGGETLTGTSYEDVIIGLGGADTLNGGDLRDIIYGHNEDGSGDDGAADSINGQNGDDALFGGDGNDTIEGGYGYDHLIGGNGNDTLIDGRQDGFSGQDLAEGGAGNDIYVYNYSSSFQRNQLSVLDTSGTDEVQITSLSTNSNFNLSDIVFIRILNEGLKLSNTQTAEGAFNILLADQFDDLGNMSGAGVEYIRFSTGLFDLKDYLINFPGFLTTEGTSLDDTIYGLASGEDLIKGKGGNDTLSGGLANDELWGEDGNDTLDGGAGNDTLYGHAGNDTYIFSDGIDTFYEPDVTVLSTDTIKFAAGIAFNDLEIYRSGTVALTIKLDANTITTLGQHFYSDPSGTLGLGHFEYLLFDDGTLIDTKTLEYETHGTSGNDNLIGIKRLDASTADTMYGFDGNDTLDGHDGNDIIDGGNGNDILRGRNGNDTYIFSAGADTIENESNGSNDVIDFGSLTFADLTIQRILAEQSDLKIIDNTGKSIVIHQQFQSGWGVEKLIFDTDPDITVSNLNTTLNGTASNETLNSISFNNGIDSLYGLGGVDILNGKDGVDYLYGGDGADTLDGSSGNDLLVGGAGNDLVKGNSDNDTYIFGLGDGSDTTLESSGSDTLELGSGINPENLTFSQSSSYLRMQIAGVSDEIWFQNWFTTGDKKVETIEFTDGFTLNSGAYANWLYATNGNSSANTIIGNSSANTIDGAGGNDQISGGAGNDTLSGGLGDDSLHGGSGTDTVSYSASATAVNVNLSTGTATGEGTDTLYAFENVTGSGYNDTLTGSSAANTLNGGTGNDMLYGKDGLDTLIGGGGLDTFVFESVSAFNNIDNINDFSLSDNDKLDIADILDGLYDPINDAITDFVQITTSGSDSLLAIDQDGTANGVNFVQIAQIAGVTGLTDEQALVNSGNLVVV